MAVSVAPGRLRHTELASGDRNYAVWTHLSPLLAFLVIGPFAGVLPLILWLARRDKSPFNDDHGREVVNMSITGAFLFVIGMITGIGEFNGVLHAYRFDPINPPQACPADTDKSGSVDVEDLLDLLAAWGAYP